MSERERIAAIVQRAAFGARPGDLDRFESAGTKAATDELLDPGAHGVPAAVDPWDDDLLRTPQPGREVAGAAIAQWLGRMVETPRPLEEWMAWFWHGHFATGIDKVRSPYLMVQQVRTLQRLALGSFPELVRAVTIDAAMLVYLDGAESTGTNPNENYGRELQELFTVGVGHYGEADVRAAAVALTGWRVGRRTYTTQYVAALHDDAPQRLQGRDGVHDLDTVVAAVTEADACAPFVAGKVARAILGPDVDADLVKDLASTFRDGGLEIRPLVRAVLSAIDRAMPMTTSPVTWLVSALRATGARPDPRFVLPALRAAGQLPFLPPNVGGWPGGSAWLSSSTVIGRYNLAGVVAAATPAGAAVRSAAIDGDLDALADGLGLPGGFSGPTQDALASLRGDGTAVLALALASPDLVVAEPLEA